MQNQTVTEKKDRQNLYFSVQIVFNDNYKRDMAIDLKHISIIFPKEFLNLFGPYSEHYANNDLSFHFILVSNKILACPFTIFVAMVSNIA